MKKQKLKVNGKVLSAVLVEVDPNKLDLLKIAPVQLLHEMAMASRKRLKASLHPTVFDLTALADTELHDEVPADEKDAEAVVTHKRLIIVDKRRRVIHGHEAVLKALEEGLEAVVVLQICEALTPEDLILLQVRHGAKEGLLFPAPRMEAIRVMVDDHKLDVEVVRAILVGPKGKKPPGKEVTSELRVGRLFERNPGYRIPFRGFDLDKSAFSNLKYLVGNNKIYDEMVADKKKEEHFLQMAIVATKTRSKRLNSEVPPLMKYDDTQKALFDQGIDQAKALLKAKHPEENTDSHPHYDLVATNEKFRSTETQYMMGKQFEDRGSAHPTLKELRSVVATVCEISTKARKELMATIYAIAPDEAVDLVLGQGAELLAERAGRRSKLYSKLSIARRQ
jgi:hypothetical protein